MVLQGLPIACFSSEGVVARLPHGNGLYITLIYDVSKGPQAVVPFAPPPPSLKEGELASVCGVPTFQERCMMWERCLVLLIPLEKIRGGGDLLTVFLSPRNCLSCAGQKVLCKQLQLRSQDGVTGAFPAGLQSTAVAGPQLGAAAPPPPLSCL